MRTASRLAARTRVSLALQGVEAPCIRQRSTEASPRQPAPRPRSDLQPGATFTLSKRFSEADVRAFAALTGDSNPIHTDAVAATACGLAAPVLPGLLSASLFPAIIGSHFPGAVYLSQTLKFKAVALVGDTLRATLTVDKCSGSRISFITTCHASSTKGSRSASTNGRSSSESSSGSSIAEGGLARVDGSIEELKSSSETSSSSISSSSSALRVVVEGTALALIPHPG